MATFTAPTALRDSSDRADVATQPEVPTRSTDHDQLTAPPWYRRTWVRRASLAALLVGAACLFLIGLSASGYGNSFYAAAAQAGSQSWKAMFFGALDAGNAITVDKPPFSLWLMALSVRIFGLSSWSVLAPQALLGVASVGVIFASVRRTSGHWAGILAGAVLALTPVATLMFRFDNPDAMLVLLLSLATYFVLRACERASGTSLVVAGILLGLGFLTKMLQAFLVLPVFVLVYLIAAPTTIKKRILHLLAAFGAMVVAFGWWVAIVELVPASWRPYVGGSSDNSIIDLILSYNGLGRIFGSAGNGGMGGGSSFGSSAGIARMFAGVSGGMVAWLIPAAMIMGAVALVALRRRPRTDLTRAAVIAWLGSLVITGLIFSFMEGTYHDYYTVALAPGIAGAVAVAGTELWRRRSTWLARVGLAAAMVITTLTAFVLLGEADGSYAALRWPVAGIGLVATLGLIMVDRLRPALAATVVALALAAGLTGPTAYAINTAATPHTGSIVTAGPVQSTGMGGGAGFGGGGNGGGGPGGSARPDGTNQQGTTQQAPTGGTRTGGGMGGGMGGGTASSELVTLLTTDASSYTWVAATTGSQTAATYQLASEQPVMAIGGFNGGDASPTLAQFQQYVADGEIHYYIAGGGSGGGAGGGMGGDGTASAIQEWVSANFTASTVGGVTVYDLTQGS